MPQGAREGWWWTSAWITKEQRNCRSQRQCPCPARPIGLTSQSRCRRVDCLAESYVDYQTTSPHWQIRTLPTRALILDKTNKWETRTNNHMFVYFHIFIFIFIYIFIQLFWSVRPFFIFQKSSFLKLGFFFLPLFVSLLSTKIRNKTCSKLSRLNILI